MTTLADTPLSRSSWLAKGEAWLDARGKPAWIAAAVLGFVLFWPVGLVFLAYMIWSKKMFTKDVRAMVRPAFMGATSSGNRAFDAYKADTLRRLEEEQHAFEAFLNRLREARDKAEFDQFMDDRAKTSDERKQEPAA
ncbi:hypothetical protein LCGC14_2954880 [marine sediment metagenome]|uniref:DUF2852 domain-containing protein n=1 Tax=marine sediment metagenome TaxID=412755 RepID=A0A0F8XEU6_9ZZZZ